MAINVIFGKGGGRIDKNRINDIDLALDLHNRAFELEKDPRTLHIAKQLYEESIRINPYLYESLYNLAIYEHKEGNDARAEELWRRCFDSHLGSLAAASLGLMNLNNKNWDEAVINLSLAIKLNPTAIEAYHNLAFVYSNVGLVMSEKRCWQRVLELDPQNKHSKMIQDRLKYINKHAM